MALDRLAFWEVFLIIIRYIQFLLMILLKLTDEGVGAIRIETITRGLTIEL